jgi:hypothetical protein
MLEVLIITKCAELISSRNVGTRREVVGWPHGAELGENMGFEVFKQD